MATGIKDKVAIIGMGCTRFGERWEAGAHEAPKCTLKMESADFLSMMTGNLPAMQAYTSGKLQIEGDIIKSQLIEQLFNM